MTLELGFEKNQIDPCMCLKQSDGEKCIFNLYVDDGIIAGNEETIDKGIVELSDKFKLKVQNGMDDFLGCHNVIEMKDGVSNQGSS